MVITNLFQARGQLEIFDKRSPNRIRYFFTVVNKIPRIFIIITLWWKFVEM
jgi:hypothetical protein